VSGTSVPDQDCDCDCDCNLSVFVFRRGLLQLQLQLLSLSWLCLLFRPCSCSTRVRVRVSDRWQRWDNSVSVLCYLFKLVFVCHTYVLEHTWMGCWFAVMVCISVFSMNSHSEGFLDDCYYCYFSFLLLLKLVGWHAVL
jgi:hypothetical protein